MSGAPGMQGTLAAAVEAARGEGRARVPASLPADGEAAGAHLDVRGPPPGEDSNGCQASGKYADRSPCDQEAELARGLGIQEREHDHRDPRGADSDGHPDRDPVRRRQSCPHAHGDKALALRIDPDLGIVDEEDRRPRLVRPRKAREPALLARPDGQAPLGGPVRGGSALLCRRRATPIRPWKPHGAILHQVSPFVSRRAQGLAVELARGALKLTLTG